MPRNPGQDYKLFFAVGWDNKTAQIVRETHDLVDAKRKKLGLPPWCWEHRKSSDKCTCGLTQ